VADALELRMAAAKAETCMAVPERKSMLARAAMQLVAAVACVKEAPEPVYVDELNRWALLAAKSMREAGLLQPAAELYSKLQKPYQAKKLYEVWG
jgi:hypothetical protein